MNEWWLYVTFLISAASPTCHTHLPLPPTTPTRPTHLTHQPVTSTTYISHRTNGNGWRVVGGSGGCGIWVWHTYLTRLPDTPTWHAHLTHLPDMPTWHNHPPHTWVRGHMEVAGGVAGRCGWWVCQVSVPHPPDTPTWHTHLTHLPDTPIHHTHES